MPAIFSANIVIVLMCTAISSENYIYTVYWMSECAQHPQQPVTSWDEHIRACITAQRLWQHEGMFTNTVHAIVTPTTPSAHPPVARNTLGEVLQGPFIHFFTRRS
jgi:hypothetical protein